MAVTLTPFGSNAGSSSETDSSSEHYGAAGEVLSYSELPAAADHAEQIWRVLTSSGIWPFSNPAGRYISDGSEWRHLSGEAELAEQILANQQSLAPTFEHYAQNLSALPQLAPLCNADGLTIEKSWQGAEGVITLRIARDAEGRRISEQLSGAIGDLLETTKSYTRDASGMVSSIVYS